MVPEVSGSLQGQIAFSLITAGRETSDSSPAKDLDLLQLSSSGQHFRETSLDHSTVIYGLRTRACVHAFHPGYITGTQMYRFHDKHMYGFHNPGSWEAYHTV